MNFLLQFSVFYDIIQSKKEMRLEFFKDLNKNKDEQDFITIKTYNNLCEIDKKIVSQFAKNYRKQNNAIFLSTSGLGYSVRNIFYRLNKVINTLNCNIKDNHESAKKNKKC